LCEERLEDAQAIISSTWTEAQGEAAFTCYWVLTAVALKHMKRLFSPIDTIYRMAFLVCAQCKEGL
jgi:hypothetical protein